MFNTPLTQLQQLDILLIQMYEKGIALWFNGDSKDKRSAYKLLIGYQF